jgi:hypothetical protein
MIVVNFSVFLLVFLASLFGIPGFIIGDEELKHWSKFLLYAASALFVYGLFN